MPLKLQLRAWQAHDDVSLDTTRPVAIVAGANASGKTAILHGLEFVFLGTGKLREIKTKGELAQQCIRDDALETEVAIAWPGAVFGRSMKTSADQVVNVNGTAYAKVTRGDAKVLQALGAEPEQIRAALEARHLLEGDANARRRILFQAAGPEVGRDRICEALEPTGLAGEDIGRLADMAATDGFKQAQTYAQGQRAARSSRLREPAMEEPEPRYNAEWAGREIRLDQISMADLEQRERELEEMLREAARDVGMDRGELREQLRQAEQKHAALVDEGAELSEREAEDLEALRETATRARSEANRRADYAETLRPKIETLTAFVAALEGMEFVAPDPCPAIPGQPKCPMTKTKLEAHRKKVLANRDSVQAELDAAVEERDANAEALRAAEAKAELDEQERDEAERVAERLTAIVGELDEAEHTIVEKKQALAAPEPAPAANREAEVQTRLDNLRQLITAKTGYESGRTTAATDKQQRERKEAERSAWDRAAKILAPDGLPAQFFGQQLPMLQNYIDEIGIAEIRVTPALDLQARVDGRWRVRTQLSESWQLRLSMAASHMVARLAHFPLLVLDRFDHLDPAGRIAVLEGARKVARHYLGGVLILATLQLEKPQPTGLPDVETFWLRDNGVERIG